MNLRLTSKKASIIMAGALLVALGSAVYAFAGHEPVTVPSYTGCLGNGGNINDVALGDTPAKPCLNNRTQIHLSGGDITAVAAGFGLTGGGSEGAVSLAVDPSQVITGVTPGFGLTGGGSGGDVTLSVDPTQVQTRVSGDCNLPGGAISQIHQSGSVTCSSGPLAIHRHLHGIENVPDDQATIGSLPLPPGMWLIIAKVSVELKDASVLEDFWKTNCLLQSQTEIDRSHAGGDTDFFAGGTLTMVLTVETTDPGSADVACTDDGDVPEVGDLEWTDLRITAIQLGDVLLP